ncbi:hypothetical protein NEAUS04_1341 [Nematocida ausubeli]|uniref:C2H2-type domain-containing protein n=1 Tax=Nematocida ausubeli (strain ATCC PRA-371 / ERTm2) TaxID=1913371 RepID=H8ZBB0_NEMA1|nr:uncharacterized protein NESG_01285 [Nematocida ausubeli]EHY66163.1 hypothetical protein NERG_00859 [Nematocida ausubeli]KAI5135896.1 hypothetical protein NEAUS07_1397 [Nematocida ausubeli]KAI5137080.1 hypothetical protein NEAUS06_2090 [Nematocida ausubeli]KAI5148854.1 hypothetical protein NEAUS05_1549 [Nematocida ausubeli]KAI5163066.1 hypothetical protein NEAUS04_1341 [Nematocida ausubeli]
MNKENKEREKRRPIPLEYESIDKALESSVTDTDISLKIPTPIDTTQSPSPFTFKDKLQDDQLDSNYQCCGISLPTLHDLVSHYEQSHYKFISTEKKGKQYVKWYGGDTHTDIVQVPTVVFNDNTLTYDYSKPTAFYNTILQSESLSLGVLLPPIVVRDFDMDAEVEMMGETHYEDEDKKRPFKCTHIGCNKKYTSAYGLKYHMSKGHTGGGMESEKPYACDVPGCGKRYKNANGLKYHFNNGH